MHLVFEGKHFDQFHDIIFPRYTSCGRSKSDHLFNLTFCSLWKTAFFSALQPTKSVLSLVLIYSVAFSLLLADNLHSSLNIYQANHSVVLEISYYLGYLTSASIPHMMLIDFFYLSDGYYLWDLSSQHWFWSTDHHRTLHLKPHFQHPLDFLLNIWSAISWNYI